MAAIVQPQSTQAEYELLYYPVLPGRGEYIRLVLEAAGQSYEDLGNRSEQDFQQQCLAAIAEDKTDSGDGNPPIYALPALRVRGAGPNGNTLLINQTANVMFYLGEKFGLLPSDVTKYYCQQVTMTAMDLLDEVHDTHHPVYIMQYYEEQKPEALKKSVIFRELRLPKYFSYFSRVLADNAKGQGKFLVGSSLTVADTTLWHNIDGLYFAFPKEMAARKKEYPQLLETYYEGIKTSSKLSEYIASNRRRPFVVGMFRYVPELDRSE